MGKLWGGRFKKSLDTDAAQFSYSIDVDRQLYTYDIAINAAHALALLEAEIISETEYTLIDRALAKIKYEMDHRLDDMIAGDEDIHSCIERLLINELGDLGKKIHTGKSRNDQVITDTRMAVKDHCQAIIAQLQSLLRSIYDQAEKHSTLIFPGFTHFQTAQPIVLGHHFLAYFEQFQRDVTRFQHCFNSADVCTLGSGALAGNNYGLNRRLVARELGFSNVSANSMDAVSDRDFMLEFLSASSILMTHLSRLSEELVLWSSPLIGFVTIGDEFTTGSSIMPQKKNPDIAELIRGKTGRVLSNFVGLQTTIKALPLTYNRDLQEDKTYFFDSARTVIDSIKCMAKMIPTLQFHADQIAASMEKGYILATDFADYLVKQGVPFRESHEITGQVVLFAESQNRQIESLTLEEFQQFSETIKDDVYQYLTLEAAVDAKNVVGGTARQQVAQQLKQIKETYKWSSNH
ncbi:argininosuccinate lyase [bacterium]|nr:argininosuccinate lyase [bacterium]